MSFSQEIAKWGAKTSKEVEDVRRGVCIKLFNAVILDTPVDTGRLRGNWRCSTQKPDYLHNVETYDPSGAETITKVAEIVNQSSGDVSVFLTNSLPYAARIEFDGWSHTKAPEGMVRKNVVRFDGLVHEVLQELKP
jgi:hypothetical protein